MSKTGIKTVKDLRDAAASVSQAMAASPSLEAIAAAAASATVEGRSQLEGFVSELRVARELLSSVLKEAEKPRYEKAARRAEGSSSPEDVLLRLEPEHRVVVEACVNSLSQMRGMLREDGAGRGYDERLVRAARAYEMDRARVKNKSHMELVHRLVVVRAGG